MRRFALLIVLTSIAWATPSSAGQPPDHRFRIDVTDPRKEITRAIDATLVIRLVRVSHEQVPHFGWEVQVVEQTPRGRGDNLLRRPTSSGGPHPSDVLAWLSRDRHFPDERILIVHGYPYEIRIRLIECRTEQIGDDASFVSGYLDITWRRLDLTRLPSITALRAATPRTGPGR